LTWKEYIDDIIYHLLRHIHLSLSDAEGIELEDAVLLLEKYKKEKEKDDYFQLQLHGFKPDQMDYYKNQWKSRKKMKFDEKEKKEYQGILKEAVKNFGK